MALEVRSWAGNAVPASLHKTNGISVLTRKGEVLRHCCHPLRPRSWRRGGRSQLTALSGPGPQTAQLSSLRGPGTQETQLALKVLSPPGQQGPGLADCIPCRLPWRLSHRGREGERFTVTSRLGPRQWAALAMAPEPGRTQSQLVPCAPQFSCWLRPGEIEGPRERATSYLILHLRTNTSLNVD